MKYHRLAEYERECYSCDFEDTGPAAASAECAICGAGCNNEFTVVNGERSLMTKETKDFTFVLECPRYGCDTWVATTADVTVFPTCYCPNHDEFVEMNAEAVKEKENDH